MSDQLDMFSSNEPKKEKLGHSKLVYKNASTILTAASGFMDAYDYSINP
jgi:hypothetical protein